MVYCLNKALHGVDWFYEIELPEWWSVEHPVGTVLGRAKYGNGFRIFQGCTVGVSPRQWGIGKPVIGENVTLMANASIIGECKIGNDVILGTGTLVKNEDVPDNCLVFGVSPNLIIKPASERATKYSKGE